MRYTLPIPHLREKKTFFQGCHRTHSPDITLKLIEPYLAVAGITRISNITHLDRLGIPVTQAIRPNSSSLTVASGKGTSLESAIVSAAMEALEYYCAETADLDFFTLTYKELALNYPCLPPEDLPLCQHSLFQIEQPERWCWGWDLLRGEKIALPWQSVILNYALCKPSTGQLLNFTMNSNGLASGNNLLEALTSGIYELIERDALTCYTQARLKLNYRKPKVILETIVSPLIENLLERFRVAGLTPVVFDCTIDTDIPVYEALCYAPTGEPISMSYGYGAHLDPEIAMIRALTEVAQARAGVIAGARDDFFRPYYTSFWLQDNRAEIAFIESYPATIDAGQRRSQATPDFTSDLDVILEKLEKIGCQRVIYVELSPTDWPVQVVRVMIPHLEGYNSRDYLPGGRASAFIKAKLKDKINN